MNSKKYLLITTAFIFLTMPILQAKDGGNGGNGGHSPGSGGNGGNGGDAR